MNSLHKTRIAFKYKKLDSIKKIDQTIIIKPVSLNFFPPISLISWISNIHT